MNIKKVIYTLVVLVVGLHIGLVWANEYEVTSDSMRSYDNITEFSGNVLVKGPDLALSGESIKVDSNTKNYDIFGKPARIEITQTTITLSVTADQIRYDADKSVANLVGNGKIVKGDLQLQAQDLQYLEAGNQFLANNSVFIINEKLEATGDNAKVNDLANSIEMIISGTPAKIRILHESSTLVADALQIKYNQNQESVQLLGNATAKYGDEELSGDSITYNLNLGSFSAAPTESGRVTAIITLP